ncbi:MAG: YqgE/AlgH family protein [Rhodospirillaceae bacterium]|nr:YqgE/AlgH family protein [Rhodospirillaceae bacterium]|tara:strand:+ start:3856 stop:4437 length:582 start_codon:yes stop_codon:yes gene_type:complete
MENPYPINNSEYLTGNLLLAMPQMLDERFMRSVIYICAHTSDGAMGLVINKIVDSVSFPELLDQLNISTDSADQEIRVHFGGPVETGRGFVLHSADYIKDATLVINDEVALTATIDILKSIADGKGPERSILTLGYAGWAPGQLDQEIQANGWLSLPADNTLVFDNKPENMWENAMKKIGIDFNMLSGQSGHA